MNADEAFFAEMLDFGVTTVEIKSGYGLDSENELKQLRVIRRLGEACAQDIAATFLGAHAIPDEYAGNADGYIDFIIERVLPVVTEQGLADFLRCLPRKFRIQRSAVAETSACGTKLGLPSKVHADEIDPLGGSSLRARSAQFPQNTLLQRGTAALKQWQRRKRLPACCRKPHFISTNPLRVRAT